MAWIARIAAVFVLIASDGVARADPRLNVVELFQSQGCSSCPPANDNVSALADREDVLALSFQVTYWDHLGWKDTFAAPAFTDRQRAYAKGLGAREVYTPQVVINGRAHLVGNDRAALASALLRHIRPPFEPVIAVREGRVQVGATRRPSEVWLVRYDPRTVQVPIGRGENAGRTLPHRNVVRALVRLGETSSASPRAFALPAPKDADWRGAILIQQPDGGPILAVSRF